MWIYLWVEKFDYKGVIDEKQDTQGEGIHLKVFLLLLHKSQTTSSSTYTCIPSNVVNERPHIDSWSFDCVSVTFYRETLSYLAFDYFKGYMWKFSLFPSVQI